MKKGDFFALAEIGQRISDPAEISGKEVIIVWLYSTVFLIPLKITARATGNAARNSLPLFSRRRSKTAYEAYSSGKHIVALYEGFVNLTLTFCYKEGNDEVIHWSALFAAGDYSRIGMYRDNIASVGIEHVNETISDKRQTVITRGSLDAWFDSHADWFVGSTNSESDPESEP